MFYIHSYIVIQLYRIRNSNSEYITVHIEQLRFIYN